MTGTITFHIGHRIAADRGMVDDCADMFYVGQVGILRVESTVGVPAREHEPVIASEVDVALHNDLIRANTSSELWPSHSGARSNVSANPQSSQRSDGK